MPLSLSNTGSKSPRSNSAKRGGKVNTDSSTTSSVEQSLDETFSAHENATVLSHGGSARTSGAENGLDLPTRIVLPKARSPLSDDGHTGCLSRRPAQDDADPFIVLKAFRLVGTVHGVHLQGLVDAIRTLNDKSIKKNVKQSLPMEFDEHDHNGDGFLDVNEFEEMVNASLWLKSAVYELTRLADEKENHIPDLKRAADDKRHEALDMLSMAVVGLNALAACIRVDWAPQWIGWDYIELGFAALFTLDLCTRWVLTPSPYHRRMNEERDALNGAGSRTGSATPRSVWSGPAGKGTLFQQSLPVNGEMMLQSQGSESEPSIDKSIRSSNFQFAFSSPRSWLSRVGWQWSCALPRVKCTKVNICLQRCCGKTGNYLSTKANILDFLATLFGWFDVAYTFTATDGDSNSFFWVSWLRWVRILRLVRLVARLGRILTYLRDLAVLLKGVIEGFRLALWGFVIIGVIIMMWAIFVRSVVVDDKDNAQREILETVFPNMARTMNYLFRCMVVKSDGSCSVGSEGSFLALLSDGLLLELLWSMTELFVTFVVLNVISAIYILQAQENAGTVADTVHAHRWRDDEDKLERLDKLLRTLIYPSRGKDRHPKQRYAHQEALKLQLEYPEIVEKIPNLEKELLELAKDVQTSREELMTAVYKYRSKELDQFRKLELTPSAKLFTFEGEEQLYVDGRDQNEVNHLGLTSPPINAKELTLLQEETMLDTLIEEAREVQRYVKSVVLPKSEWANKTKAGSSGVDKWKESGSLFDEAIDPGPKDEKRVKKKCKMRYDGRYERNRDYARLGMIYDSVEHLVQALPKFLDGIGDNIRLASIENRFVQPHPLGWRDINLLLKVQVPSTGAWHIMEVQLMLRELKELRPINHIIYEHVRSIPDDVLTRIMDRLVTDTTLDLNMSKNEWNQCLDNREVKELLDHFQIPVHLRKRLFDLIDLSDSGIVSSAELQEMLRLHRIPAQGLEILACHLRVREVQRFSRLKLKDEISRPIIRQMKSLFNSDVRKSTSFAEEPAFTLELPYVASSFAEVKKEINLKRAQNDFDRRLPTLRTSTLSLDKMSKVSEQTNSEEDETYQSILGGYTTYASI